MPILSRYSTDLPPRSCSQNEKPPELPSPGMAGGMNANANASGICVISRLFNWVTSDLACCAASRRSSHGFNVTNAETGREVVNVEVFRIRNAGVINAKNSRASPGSRKACSRYVPSGFNCSA